MRREFSIKFCCLWNILAIPYPGEVYEKFFTRRFLSDPESIGLLCLAGLGSLYYPAIVTQRVGPPCQYPKTKYHLHIPLADAVAGLFLAGNYQ